MVYDDVRAISRAFLFTAYRLILQIKVYRTSGACSEAISISDCNVYVCLPAAVCQITQLHHVRIVWFALIFALIINSFQYLKLDQDQPPPVPPRPPGSGIKRQISAPPSPESKTKEKKFDESEEEEGYENQSNR